MWCVSILTDKFTFIMANSIGTSPKQLYGNAISRGGSSYEEIGNPHSATDLGNVYIRQQSEPDEAMRSVLPRDNSSIITIPSKSDSQSTTSSQSPSSRCVTILCFVSMISIILAASACGLLVHLWFRCEQLEQMLGNTQSTTNALREEPGICLACDELAQGPFREDNTLLNSLIQREEGGTKVCCAKTAAQMSTLFDLFASRKQLKNCAEAIANSSELCNGTRPHAEAPSKGQIVSAHLLAGKQTGGSSGSEENVPLRHWVTDKVTAHLTGIELIMDRLIVPESGLYFLYSQIVFQLYYDTSVNGRRPSLSHTITRYSPRYPNDGTEILLQSISTQCKYPTDFGRYPSYVAGAVRLVKGDAIYVTVPKFSLSAVHTNQTSYFGLYKLGD